MALHIVIDGSNVACLPAGAKPEADLHRLERLIAQVQEQAGSAHVIKVFVDASLRHKVSPTDQARLDALVRAGDVTQVPAGTSADDFLLPWADANDAIVISNDQFRPYQATYPWLRSTRAGRCVTGIFDISTQRWALLERNSGPEPARGLAELAAARKPDSASAEVSAVGVAPAGPYKMRVSTAYPHGVVILLDHSGSMRAVWGDGATRAERLAAIVNRTITELVLRSTREAVKHYFDVAVIGYGGDARSGVRSCIPGTTLDHPFVAIDELERLAVIVEEEVSGRVRARRSWISPRAAGETPMAEALEVAHAALVSYTEAHPDSFPPVVMNITDGDPSFADPLPVAERIKQLHTTDGGVVLFSAHIGETGGEPLRYPAELPPGVPREASLLYEMASVLPDTLRAAARDMGIRVASGGRACVTGAGPDEVIGMLNVGTQGTQGLGAGADT